MAQNDFQVSTDLPPQPYAEEWKRSCPNYLVYHPAPDGNPRWHDDDFFLLNEHFIVQSTSDDHLVATWTAHGPACRFRRVVTARSNDGGKNWTKPQIVDGGPDVSASWSVPVVSPGGRIYLFYCWYPDGVGKYSSCELACRISDDEGRTWSGRHCLAMRRTEIDHPEHSPHFVAWRQPEWDRHGRPLIGFTRIGTSEYLRDRHPKRKWCQSECFRIENIDSDPPPEKLDLSYLPENPDDALTVPQPEESEVSWANEPSFCPLPDGRIFITMRTRTGRLYWSLRDQNGNFREPSVMHYHDDGEEVLQPGSPAPLFRLSEERYLLVFNNNDGHVFGAEGTHDSCNRRPCYLSFGRFDPDAEQPVSFNDPVLFADNDGIPFDAVGNEPRYEAAAYGSLTKDDDGYILWYPDRKHYLVGKRIPDTLDIF